MAQVAESHGSSRTDTKLEYRPEVQKLKKKHSKTSPEIQFKDLNEKFRCTLPDHQIN